MEELADTPVVQYTIFSFHLMCELTTRLLRTRLFSISALLLLRVVPWQLDPKFDRMVLESIQGVLPLRVGSISLCYPPSFFRIAWAIFSKFMSKWGTFKSLQRIFFNEIVGNNYVVLYNFLQTFSRQSCISAFLLPQEVRSVRSQNRF